MHVSKNAKCVTISGLFSPLCMSVCFSLPVHVVLILLLFLMLKESKGPLSSVGCTYDEVTDVISVMLLSRPFAHRKQHPVYKMTSSSRSHDKVEPVNLVSVTCKSHKQPKYLLQLYPTRGPRGAGTSPS